MDFSLDCHGGKKGKWKKGHPGKGGKNVEAKVEINVRTPAPVRQQEEGHRNPWT